MLGSDRCPYCGVETGLDVLNEIRDINGNIQDELEICPNCRKYIRVSFETRNHISITSEEYYLENLKLERENYEKTLNSEYGQNSKNFYRMMIDEVDRKIKIAKANIEENKELTE